MRARATAVGIAASANAQRNPTTGIAQPASSGPSVKPRSPQNRKTPTAVPDTWVGATSDSIAPGGTPAAPDIKPSTASRTPSSSGVGAQPTAAVATTSSAASATAITTPIPTVDRPSTSLANSGTRVSNTTATIHR